MLLLLRMVQLFAAVVLTVVLLVPLMLLRVEWLRLVVVVILVQ